MALKRIKASMENPPKLKQELACFTCIKEEKIV